MMYTYNMKKCAWHVLYYEKKDGTSPVYDFIESLTQREKAKILNWIELLEQQGPQLPRPYADLLEDGIHELRSKLSGNQIRVLYFFCFREFIVLTHSFIKNTDKIPVTEIAKAKQYRADFLARNNEKELRRTLNEDV
jgi:phage-related protein